MRIDHPPLARPVGSNTFVAVNSAAFHAIRPLDIGPHRGQSAVEVPRVEGRVGPFE